MLYDERTTGIVTFTSGGTRARVLLRSGLLVGIEIDGQLEPTASAAQTLAQLTDGAFEFEATATVEGTPGDPATAEILASMRSPIEAEPLVGVPTPR